MHVAIQSAFLQHDLHQRELEVDDRPYSGLPVNAGFSYDHMFKPSSAYLSMLSETRSVEFLYVYHMGDDWAHYHQVLEFFTADPGT